MRRERLSAGAWFARVWWWRRSGMSARAWCLAQGIPYSTFLSWRGRLVRELAGGPLPFRRFVP
jgi:hypothetical protein